MSDVTVNQSDGLVERNRSLWFCEKCISLFVLQHVPLQRFSVCGCVRSVSSVRCGRWGSPWRLQTVSGSVNGSLKKIIRLVVKIKLHS